MRVSGGHLCEAEAPTEPTGETADPYKIKYIKTMIDGFFR